MFKCLKSQIRRCGEEPSMQVAFFPGMEKGQEEEMVYRCREKKRTGREAGE
jgi:hypothetical protein